MRHLFLLALLLCAGSASAADAAPAKDPNEGKVLEPATWKVWTTEKGSKYHLKDCQFAKIETTVAQAIIEGDSPCSACKPPVYDPAAIVVFTSDSGKKYHLFNCRYAKAQTTLDKAVADGLEACGTCKPPLLWKAPAASVPATAAAPAKPGN